MFTTTTPPLPILPLITLLLLLFPQPTHLLPYPIPTLSTATSLLSLSHSLLTRLANLRASRGDTAGSARLRSLADTINPDFRSWRFLLSVGWDYLRNYAWRDVGVVEVVGVLRELNELGRVLGELGRLDEFERVSWVRRNYGDVLRVAKSLFVRLLKVFRQSGPLRDIIESVQREVVDGDLLRDCLELGSNDLTGFIQVLKDIFSQFPSTNGRTEL